MTPFTPPDDELIAVFEVEVVESVTAMRERLTSLYRPETDRVSALNEVLRLVHDLKGSSRVVGYTAVGEVAHALESLLLRCRDEGTGLLEHVNLLLRATDILEQGAMAPRAMSSVAAADVLLNELAGCDVKHRGDGGQSCESVSSAACGTASLRVAPTVGASTAAESTPPKADTLRVLRCDVDALSDGISETLVSVQSVETNLKQLDRAMRAMLSVMTPGDGSGSQDWSSVARSYSDTLLEARSAAAVMRESLRRVEGNVREVDDGARRLCLVSAGPLAVHLERVAREAAESLGKRITVDVLGRDLWIDIAVIEALKGPLAHAVRNAIDHGIENAEERKQAGKSDTGKLTIAFADERDSVRVVISDDGRGVDVAAVRGRLRNQGEGLDDRQVLCELLRARVSTRDQVTNLSGRGIGLSAVAVVADELRGDVALESTPGAGTVLTVDVPRRLSLLEGLVVQAGVTFLVIPLSGLAGVDRLNADAEALTRVLALPPCDHVDLEAMRTIRFRSRGGDIALTVDRVLDQCEVVRRPLGAHLGRVRFVSGATVLPSGEPALIVDPREIAEAVHLRQQGELPEHPESRRGRVLLVDDSATVRASLRDGLCAAGFEVLCAENGQVALEHLAMFPCDVIVSDVQMPLLGGFALLEACQGRNPFVLITALPNESDAQRAKSLGALAYIPKNESLSSLVVATVSAALSHCGKANP
ncbi:MAG: hybrid sensor histidine kinase/response regulator [Planctomycetota bacterium]